jgi:hypothetical protein
MLDSDVTAVHEKSPDHRTALAARGRQLSLRIVDARDSLLCKDFQYEEARNVATLAYAATQSLDVEQAQIVIDGLVASVPVLAGAVKRRVTPSPGAEQPYL